MGLDLGYVVSNYGEFFSLAGGLWDPFQIAWMGLYFGVILTTYITYWLGWSSKYSIFEQLFSCVIFSMTMFVFLPSAQEEETKRKRRKKTTDREHRDRLKTILGGFKYFLFSPLPGEDSHFD